MAVGGLESYGDLTLDPATHDPTNHPTQLINAGTWANSAGTSDPYDMYFGDGSSTVIATPATAGSFEAGIDLDGHDAFVTGMASPCLGATFRNNGYVVDSFGSGTKTVISDHNALVLGAGFWQNSVTTQNGGRFQSGNSPGVDHFSNFTFGPGGVDNLNFCINNATGTAGPTPDSNGQVSGPYDVDLGCGGITQYGAYTARSYHTGGVNALFMDGSVKFVTNSIDQATWRALGTRNGGEVVDPTKY